MIAAIVLFVLAAGLFVAAFFVKFSAGPGGEGHEIKRARFASQVVAVLSGLCLIGAVVAVQMK